MTCYRFPRLKPGFLLLQLQLELTKREHVVNSRYRLEGLIHPRVNPWCSVFDRIKGCCPAIYQHPISYLLVVVCSPNDEICHFN